MIAVVYVDVKHQAVDRGFDYLVPDFLAADCALGQRVEVPFGQRILSGVIIGLKAESDHDKLKPIRAILDIQPVFTEEHLALAKTLARRYLTPLASYLAAMLPSALRMTYEKYVRVVEPSQLPEALAVAFKRSRVRKASDILALDVKAYREALQAGTLEPYTEVRQKQQAKQEPYIRLLKHCLVRGAKQQAVLKWLADGQLHKQKDVLDATAASAETLKSLIKHGCIEVVSKEVLRERESLRTLKDKHVTLTAPQQAVVDAVLDALQTPQTFVLHGVTSSGKTEVYIALAEAVLKTGKSLLILVPEISLTPMLTARFKSRFGKQVAVYHSRLTAGEQYDAWRLVKQGRAQIMIGARSAIFAPFQALGLIIMDEAHSDSYRQSENPMYDAAWLAKERAKTHHCPLILGSATPTLDMMYATEQGDNHLLELKARVLESVLPDIERVDMRTEFLRGNTSIFSKQLLEAMQMRLAANEQSLLLINRRGHARFVLCRACGKTVDCDSCDLPKAYHHHDDTLKCHYCQNTTPMPKTCPHCGSIHIRYMGLGSERVEAEVKQYLPQAVVVRMDRDTTGTKDAHETLLQAFEDTGDILVGTQMIAKGLDFPRVTLVGVLSADMSLYVPDPYAREETFSLLTQVAGRSGRRAKKGQVIIQAYDADHPILTDVAEHDFKRFYHRELAFRKQMGMPPHVQVMTVRISHPKVHDAHKRCIELMRHLKQHQVCKQMVGPARPARARSRGLEHYVLMLRYTDEAPLLDALHDFFSTHDAQSFQWRIDHRPNLM
ncbi:MAG: primosomal protein N' [Acholeplasmatales bacterium]|nr:MAG: primosomal protein N' [Acholeplasmatales bacterium]